MKPRSRKMRSTMAAWVDKAQDNGWSVHRRNLVGACLAHLLHDGYTDQIYALLPIWQHEFGLSYAGVAFVRSLYSGTMGGLQVPATRLTARLTARTVLFLATFVAAAGYIVAVLPLGLGGLCIGLMLAGVGSSLQHPRASLLVTDSYGIASRSPLGIYNFSGDLGKAIFPAVVSLLLLVVAWRLAVGLTVLVGLVVSVALLALVPWRPCAAAAQRTEDARGQSGIGFHLLLTIGALDTGTRMGYLLFLPFLLHAKGGREVTVGVGLALLFAGGALGKACCGWLGLRLGVVWSVIVTEAATALLIVATLMVSLGLALALLPFLGIVLNGTSSVLYGTVPELAKKGDVGAAFAVFYTGVITAGGLAPIAYGAIADHFSRAIGVAAVVLTAAAIIPIVFALRPFLRGSPAK